MAQLVADAGLSDRIEVDSAGTGAWHVGQPADGRATAEAAGRGIALTSRGRQVHAGDFHHFDLLVAMDERNRQDLLDLAPAPELRAKVRLLRSFDPALAGLDPTSGALDVPDPYYGGPRGFADVFDLVESACHGLLTNLTDPHGSSTPPSGGAPAEPAHADP